MLIQSLAMAGGLFAVFTFVHFITDWIFQSHKEAMNKHNNWRYRAGHCLTYTVGFVPLLLFLHLSLLYLILSLNILFWSHFYLDSYHLVYLWAKYIRKPPEMTELQKVPQIDGYVEILPPDPKLGFVKFVQTPLGKILMITVDQLTHLMCLWPIIWMAMQ